MSATQQKGAAGRGDCVSRAVFACARLVIGVENRVHAYFEVAQIIPYMLQTLEGLQFRPEVAHATLLSGGTEQIPSATLQHHYSHSSSKCCFPNTL